MGRFLREDDDVDERQLSWDDRVAKKFYSSLYREYAVCDLKHYNSGNVSKGPSLLAWCQLILMELHLC